MGGGGIGGSAVRTTGFSFLYEPITYKVAIPSSTVNVCLISGVSKSKYKGGGGGLKPYIFKIWLGICSHKPAFCSSPHVYIHVHYINLRQWSIVCTCVLDSHVSLILARLICETYVVDNSMLR